jgi:hypothetical protein
MGDFDYLMDLYEFDSSMSGAIRLDHGLDENTMQVLVECGLQDRFPTECNTWAQCTEEARRNSAAGIKKEEAAVKEKLAGASGQLEILLREAIVNEVTSRFPYVTSVASIIADGLTSSSSTLCRKRLGCPDEKDDKDLARPAGAGISSVLWFILTPKQRNSPP